LPFSQIVKKIYLLRWEEKNVYSLAQYYHPKNAEQDKRLTKLLRKLVCTEQFLTDEEISNLKETVPGVEIIDIIPLSDKRLKEKFWFCEVNKQQAIVSTKEIEAELKKGSNVKIISGHHDTFGAAQYSCDMFWEIPGD
jgi:hypothetical protein